MARTDPQVNIRMKPENLKRLRGAAAASGRSVTDELNLLIESSTPATSIVRTQLRLPAETYNSLLAASKSSGRSMNAEMVHRIEQTLD